MIGIDVGGANLKIVTDESVDIHYCPLWEKAPISDILNKYRDEEDAVVVMSGELADSFRSKKDGISFIVNSVRNVFPKARFYGTDGHFYDGPHESLAAANWYAMADYLRDHYPDALLVDMGSTTTDIIPLNAFQALSGETDLTRLQKGYLLYLGTLRTPVSSLIRSVMIHSTITPVSTEFFSCAGDVHVALGKIPAGKYSTPTPDHKGTDLHDCLIRLARTVCADLDEIGEEAAYDIAQAYYREEKELITSVIRQVIHRHSLDSVVCTGIGSSIIASWTGGTDLTGLCGDKSDAFPAFAVREVALRGI